MHEHALRNVVCHYVLKKKTKALLHPGNSGKFIGKTGHQPATGIWNPNRKNLPLNNIPACFCIYTNDVNMKLISLTTQCYSPMFLFILKY